ncbi:hypothetical protein [Streptomyces spinosirectus]
MISHQLLLGTASILGALLLATGVARRHFRPSGQHRATDVIEVSLTHLMPTWPEPAQRPLVPQGFRVCKPCGGEVPVAIYEAAHCCANGHITITGGDQ